MNKRIIAITFLLLSLSMLFSDPVSFSGGKSRLVMREGEKSVSLTEGAAVTSGSLSITADELNLKGDDWNEISGKGHIVVKDGERGLEIRTESIYYDRNEEILVISSWFDLDDTTEELYAQAGSLRYDMESERLEMGMQVVLMKISEGEVMTCRAESILYDKEKNLLSLRGGAKVEWKGDTYEAEVITVNTEDNSITLSGRIKGTING